LFFVAAFLFGAVVWTGSGFAFVDDCVKCHGVEGTTVLIEGESVVAPVVDIEAMTGGVHAGLSCLSCHGDGFSEVPHVVMAGAPGCGVCHVEVDAAYRRSVHGRARERGVTDAPACTGCHGAHAIRSSDDPISTVYAGNVPAACSKCHAEERIAGKYGLAADRLETYEHSYHGIANRYGVPVVANCASCHGIHDILPSSDPSSSIASANLGATCGKCHVGAGERFAIGKVHVEPTRESSKGMFYVRRFYTVLIVVLAALFVLHIAMDLAAYKRKRQLGGDDQRKGR
jgi:hypothetical protein